jgi:hypothetical protein
VSAYNERTGSMPPTLAIYWVYSTNMETARNVCQCVVLMVVIFVGLNIRGPEISCLILRALLFGDTQINIVGLNQWFSSSVRPRDTGPDDCACDTKRLKLLFSILRSSVFSPRWVVKKIHSMSIHSMSLLISLQLTKLFNIYLHSNSSLSASTASK